MGALDASTCDAILTVTLTESITYMAQLTQEHFDDQLQKLATKEALDQQSKDLMSSIRYKNSKLLSKVALQADLDQLKGSVESIESTLDAHTTVLDKILKNSEHWKTEAAALSSALQRHESWIKQLAGKIGIKLET